MENLMLLGDEAIAQAAIDSGISGIYAYPGTPSTEITEYVQMSVQATDKKIRSNWSVNEKTAMEAALGMSYAGKRAMVCMKHVGLNVAADAFINSALTGVNGGLVVVVADDPSMHSSQNEQDSRFYGKFAMIPGFEPSNQQQAYDMTRAAYEMSEKYKIPVLLRITTRLAHSRSGINREPASDQNKLSMPSDPRQFILLPAIARVRYKNLLSLQKDFARESEESVFNIYSNHKPGELGIITTGIAWNYVKECFGEEEIPYPVLKIGQYPYPVEKVKNLLNRCKEVFVFEEGYPFVEEMIKGINEQSAKIHGRLDATLPKDGELNPDLVANVLGFKTTVYYKVPAVLETRLPVLCIGCAHVDLYHALNEAMSVYGKGKVFSDIGCYTLGALPPFEAIFSCVDMGASVTMAKGAADAGLFPSACVIGDSTFTHSGITGLLDAVNENSPVTVIISDNSTTGMTGGQKSSATGKIENICRGLGVDPKHLRMMNPLKKNMEENVKMIRDELEFKGVSVIISQRECIQTAARRHRNN
jgi:indolepyruvate ferredoxin oxidoreductase alpha subunit